MDTLKNLVEEDTLYEIFIDNANSRLEVGYILAYDDEWALIEDISVDGTHDGYKLLLVGDIIKLQYGTSYLKKFEDLMAAKRVSRKPLDFSNSGLFRSVIDFIMTNRFVCTVEIDGDRLPAISGHIERADIDTFRMEIVDSNGMADGHMIAEYADVVSIRFNSAEELNLAILNLFNT